MLCIFAVFYFPAGEGRKGVKPYRAMKLHLKRAGVCLLVLCLLMIAAGTALGESADPIRVSSLSEPQSVISEQDVSITIKIYNSSQQDMDQPITLFDPEGMSVEKYAGLGAEQSVTYTGAWHVTTDQIAKGRINYYIRYSVNGKDNTRTIPVTIQTEDASPQLIANYAISPASVRAGQQVNVAYTLSNTGNIELRDITIANKGISSNVLSAAALSVGERIVLEDSFTMGSEQLVSEPEITYRAADSEKMLTVPDMARRTLTPAKEGLEVSLEASNTENIYPGESVQLTLKLKNTGDTPYIGLTAVLPDGTELAKDVELAVGTTFEENYDYVPTGSGSITASVTGTDPEGDMISMTSPAVTFTIQDASMALVLDVQAAADSSRIYSEPAVLRCAVRVSNIGETDATTLTITEAGTTVATIPSLPSGESRTAVFEIETSIGGQIQFEVSGKDAAGNEKSYASNILDIVYVEPTPAPTATPRPTAVPPTPSPVPTATPVPTLMDRITDSVNPLVLKIIAGVLAGLIALIVIVNAVRASSRRKLLKNALDTIDRSPDTRDPSGKHAKKAPKKEKKDTQIAQTTELTEEEGEKEKSRPAAKPRETEHRRRNAADADREVSSDPTLRVAPADQRPETPRVTGEDKSKTKVFSRNADPEPEKTRRMQTVSESHEEEPYAGGTVRLDRDDVNKLKGETEKGKEKRGLFGHRKAKKVKEEEPEEDLFE